jgi:hypothetical protein
MPTRHPTATTALIIKGDFAEQLCLRVLVVWKQAKNASMHNQHWFTSTTFSHVVLRSYQLMRETGPVNTLTTACIAWPNSSIIGALCACTAHIDGLHFFSKCQMRPHSNNVYLHCLSRTAVSPGGLFWLSTFAQRTATAIHNKRKIYL